MPSNLLCSHLPLQAPDAALCPLHLPRSRQPRCLQLRKLLLQAERPLSSTVQLMPKVPHLHAWVRLPQYCCCWPKCMCFCTSASGWHMALP